MKRLALILSLLLPAVCWGGPAQLKNARIVDLDDRTQVILDLSGPVKYDTLLLRNPVRLVADLYDTRPRSSLDSLSLDSPAVNRVRFGIRDGRHLRVVLDLAAEGRTDARLLAPDGRHGHRLVLEVHRRGGTARAASRPVVKKGQRQYVIAIDAGHGGKDPGAVGSKGTREKDITLAVAKRLKTLIDREPGMRAVLTRSDDRYLKLRERIYLARKHKADLFVSIHADAFADPKARGSSVFILSTRGASSEAARMLANRENAADLMGGYNLTGKDDDVAYVVLDLFQEAAREASLSLADKVLGRLGKVGKLHKHHVEHAGFAVLKSPDMPSILVETAFITNPGEEEKLRSGRHQAQLAKAVLDGIRAYVRERPLNTEVLVAENESVPPSPESVPPVAPEPPAGRTPPAVRRVVAQRPRPAVAPAATPVAAVPAVAVTAGTATAVQAPLSPLPKPVLLAKPLPVAAPLVLQAKPAVLPVPAPRPESRQVHITRRGETLQDIARRYRVDLMQLLSANGLASNRLRMPAGTPLTIPEGDI